MPILSWFYYCALNESWRFLGTCAFAERDSFQKKVDALCTAYGWSPKSVTVIHHYTNSIRDNLEQL
jgi:hypothetical protein